MTVKTLVFTTAETASQGPLIAAMLLGRKEFNDW